jgi:hypothetical protein
MAEIALRPEVEKGRTQARPKNGAGALTEARREVVRRCLPFRLEHDRHDRTQWGGLGLTLAQRDRAVEELVAAKEATIHATGSGIIVRAVVGRARP